MIPFACNFCFQPLGKKIFAAPFLILDMIYMKCKPMNTARCGRGQKHGDLLTNSSPSLTLLMPSECYKLYVFFLSVSFLFGPSEAEVGVTGCRPSCWGCCSGRGGPSSSGCRLLRRWRCGCRDASPPAWRRHRCCGRWTAWRVRC